MKLNIFCINKHTQSTNRKADEQARLKSGNWLYIIDRSLYLATGATYSSLLPPVPHPLEKHFSARSHIYAYPPPGASCSPVISISRRSFITRFACDGDRLISPSFCIFFFPPNRLPTACISPLIMSVSWHPVKITYTFYFYLFFFDLLANSNGQSGEINLIRTRT